MIALEVVFMHFCHKNKRYILLQTLIAQPFLKKCRVLWNSVCERFHKTTKQEFYDTAFRKKIYTSIEQLQQDVDSWLMQYNYHRSHSGKYCYGKTLMQTFMDSKHIALEKSNESMYNNNTFDSLNLSDHHL
ncbi:IS481 family transposase domain protein [Rickettsiales endosymbiont of Paramecium tredecaurelia]|nr:IS481 family transposase domain protein [Candidatus Sarmatiella mevalonica]